MLTESLTTLDGLLALFPHGGLLRFVAGRDAEHTSFYRWDGAQWAWPPGAKFPDTPATFLQKNADYAVRLSPWTYAAPDPAAITGSVWAWCAFPVAAGPQRKHWPHPALDAGSEARALTRLREAQPPPTCIIHEGTRVAGWWRLAALHDPAAVERINWRLAVRLDAPRQAPADVRAEAFAVPGQLAPGTYPARHVAVLLDGADRWYKSEEL